MTEANNGSIPTNVPAEVRKTIKDGDIYYLAGVGNKDADVMFVTPSALAEEVEDEIKLSYGKPLKQKPGFLKGPAGTIFKDLAARCGLDMDKCFYTSICRWLLPRDIRLRPKKNVLALGMPSFMAEFERVKPRIIVCLGKPVFEQIVRHVKGSVMDLNGAWFDATDLRHDEQPCLVYLMEDITKLVSKPEYIERFRQDLKAVRQMLLQLEGVVIDKFPLEYETIHNKAELIEWLAKMRAMGVRVLSVDCEWHGDNHIDGHLRSIQFCWAPGKAVYIRFMDDDLNYVFDCSYKEAGGLMKDAFDELDMKFIGHHISADLPWMHHVLGLDWYDKAIFDSEYGQQCVDEYEPRGLERMSLKYTDLGRYDIELYLWRKDKKNKEKADGGFGRIPDRILIPYACKDVDVVMRAWPKIMAQMERQPGLVDYYNNTFNPFVTNFFTSYALNGLPMDIDRMDELRELYGWVRDEMIIEFRQEMLKEAEALMLKQMSQFGPDGIIAFSDMQEHLLAGQPGEALAAMKKVVGADKLSEIWPFYEHLLVAPYFNINNSRQKQRWLFEVKKFTPVKSTGNKDKGMPSVSWDKVLTYTPEKQKEFNPSADGQTIEILQTQYKDPLLRQLLELTAVATVCKVFLKEAIVDEDGEVLKEQGLHFWLASDGRVHGQMSSTETGRPRSWKPNSLNWPSWVNKKISEGMAKLFLKRLKEGHLPDKFKQYLPADAMTMKEDDVLKYVAKSIPPIRACVVSLEGWCIVESDYQTAELRGQAFLSACDDMMDLITKPDKNFVRVKPDRMVDEDCVARVGFPSYIPENERDPKWLNAYGVDGEVKKAFEPDDYLRDEHGNLVYSKQDLHWSLAEMVQKKPREALVKKRDRNAAKVGNFSSAYGATGQTLERKIEADTGIKPEPGVGDALLAALEERQPRATAWLKSLEQCPLDPGFMQALSGRIRHFYTHPDSIAGLSQRTRDGQVSALGREARNFPMQESVAATACRASKWLMEFGMRYGLQGFILTILYDSVVTMCPENERVIWAKAHKLFMFLRNGWNAPTRVLRYPIDTELNRAWSWKPSKEDKEKLANEEYEPTPEHLKKAEEWLDSRIQLYESNEELSIF